MKINRYEARTRLFYRPVASMVNNNIFLFTDVLILSVSIGGSLGGLSLMYATYKMFIYVREKTRY